MEPSSVGLNSTKIEIQSTEVTRTDNKAAEATGASKSVVETAAKVDLFSTNKTFALKPSAEASQIKGVIREMYPPDSKQTEAENSKNAFLKKSTKGTQNPTISVSNYRTRQAPHTKTLDVPSSSNLRSTLLTQTSPMAERAQSREDARIPTSNLIAERTAGVKIPAQTFLKKAREIQSQASTPKDHKLAAQYFEKAAEKIQTSNNNIRKEGLQLESEKIELQKKSAALNNERIVANSTIKGIEAQAQELETVYGDILKSQVAAPAGEREKKPSLLKRASRSTLHNHEIKHAQKIGSGIKDKLAEPIAQLKEAHQKKTDALQNLKSIETAIQDVKNDITIVEGMIDLTIAHYRGHGGEVEKTASMVFTARIESANCIEINSTHPINQVLAQNEMRYVSNLDSGVVKSGYARVEKKQIMDEQTGKPTPVSSIDLTISRFARFNLDENLAMIEAQTPALNTALADNKMLGDVSISKGEYVFLKKNNDGTYTEKGGYIPSLAGPDGPEALQTTIVKFEGVGEVSIVDNSKMGSLYQDVSVRIIDTVDNPGQAAQQMLSILGLGPVFSSQTDGDVERLKMAKIFHTKFPAAAVKIEHDQSFYECSLDDLRRKMIALDPRAEAELQKYLKDQPELMQKVEIMDGMETWILTDLSTEVRQNGAVGLMMSITGWGEGSDMEKLARALSGVLISGGLSSKNRLQNGLIVTGSSTSADLSSGGGPGVFMRAVPENSLDYDILSTYVISGDGRLIVDLDALNEDCYGYASDLYGVKSFTAEKYSNYAERKPLPELITDIKNGVESKKESIKISKKSVAIHLKNIAELKKTASETEAKHDVHAREQAYLKAAGFLLETVGNVLAENEKANAAKHKKETAEEKQAHAILKEFQKKFKKIDPAHLSENDMSLLASIIEKWGNMQAVTATYKANSKQAQTSDTSLEKKKADIALTKKTISETGAINNEIIKKSRLQPHHIKGFVVDTEEEKQAIIVAMEGYGLIYEEEGIRKINGIEVDKFFHASKKFTKEMWTV